MTDQPNTPAADAATVAAQNVVDNVTSYEYSGDEKKIGDQLDGGLEEAGVSVDDAERDRLIKRIDALKQDEEAGTPEVQAAEPAEPSNQ